MYSGLKTTLFFVSILSANGHSGHDESEDSSCFEHATKSRYFVDKTRLLKHIIQNDTLLITCPKDFGKSTNLDMIRRFFQNPSTKSETERKASLYYKLFTDKSLNLEISKDEKFVNEHFGRYQTISINFTNVHGDTSQAIIHSVRDIVSKAVAPFEKVYADVSKNHSNGLASDKQTQEYHRIAADNIFRNQASDFNAFSNDLRFVLKEINRHFDRKVVALIDDYDAPIMRAVSHGVNASQINYAVLSLIDELSISNGYVLVAGVSRPFIQGLSHLPQSNKLKRYYFLEDDNELAEYFGFTESDIDRLMATKHVHNGKRDENLKYFNGYNFKTDHQRPNDKVKSSLYNAGAVLRYLQGNKLEDHSNDHLVPKLMKCLRHRAFFTNITRLLTRQSIPEYRNNELSTTDLNTLFESVKNNCSKLPPYFVYTMYLIDHGYATWTTTNRIQIPNLIMEMRLKREFERFYHKTYGITMYNVHIANSMRTILDSNTTTDNMIFKLSQSLDEVLQPKLFNGSLNEFEFKSIIVGILYCNIDFHNEHITTRKTHQQADTTQDNIDLLVIPNQHHRIILIIKINFYKTLYEALLEAREYEPIVPPDKPDYYMLKYIAINTKLDRIVEIGWGDNRQIIRGQVSDIPTTTPRNEYDYNNYDDYYYQVKIHTTVRFNFSAW